MDYCPKCGLEVTDEHKNSWRGHIRSLVYPNEVPGLPDAIMVIRLEKDLDGIDLVIWAHRRCMTEYVAGV